MSIDYQKVVRLLYQGMSFNSIATAIGSKWETIDRINDRCIEKWGAIKNVPTDISSETIQKIIYGKEDVAPDPNYLQPDCEMILNKQRTERAQRKELWAEYVTEANGRQLLAYKISRFNEIVSLFAKKHDVSISRQLAPGIEAQVDWVGDKAKIVDKDSGEEETLHLFVIALPYSSYFYVEAFNDEKMDSWLAGHKHAFEFFGGCPARMVPDNCKTAVNQSRKWYYESVVLNPKYESFMDHYDVVVMPARVYHPKDKSVVERCVQIVENDLMRPLAKLEIHSIQEYNELLWKKLEKRLAENFSKKIGSRTSIFLEEEKNELLPLPIHEYQSIKKGKAIVGRDFHIQWDKAFYSVPTDHIGDNVRIEDDGFTVRIKTWEYVDITIHRKALIEWQKVTNKDHIPAHYGENNGYSPEYFRAWASHFGPNTVAWVDMMLDHWTFIVHAFRPLHTGLMAAKGCDKDVVENACAIAVHSRVYATKGLKALIESEKAKKEASKPKKNDVDLNDIYYSRSEGGDR